MIMDIIQTIRIMLTENNIPYEIQQEILFKQKGIQHPIVEGIQLYWDYMRDNQNAFEKISLYNEPFVAQDGTTRNRIATRQTTLDYPVLHFPITFNLGLMIED